MLSSPIIKDNLKIMGENIRLARLRRQITATMLAERAGISRLTLRRAENGDRGVSIGVIARLLVCLGIGDDLCLLARDDPLGRRLQDASLTRTKQRVAKRTN